MMTFISILLRASALLFCVAAVCIAIGAYLDGLFFMAYQDDLLPFLQRWSWRIGVFAGMGSLVLMIAGFVQWEHGVVKQHQADRRGLEGKQVVPVTATKSTGMSILILIAAVFLAVRLIIVLSGHDRWNAC